MIFVSVNLFDEQFGSVFRQFFEDFHEILLDTRIKDFLPVFGWPYQVVVTGKDKVAHPTVRDHST